MKRPEWQFASTGGGVEDGVSNPEIEYFEGDYNYFLAREILQNALDARLDENLPVRVEFKLESYSQRMFPGFEEFVEIWKKAKSYWPLDNVKCHNFLDNGLNCLNSEKINVLKISDYNTLGLNGGDSDKNGSWFGLVKSVGSSNKNDGQGGSFGIGKGAPFAASFLRTCFYSTKNEYSQNVYQGVSKIVSFSDEENDVKRGYGSFGLKNQSSIKDRFLIDNHMVREERGLDLFIMGYKLEDNWQLKLLESVLRNFWPAIYHNELEVVIDNEKLNSENLEEKLTKYFINKPVKDNDKPEGNPLEYFRAYKNSDKTFPIELIELGKVSFYFRATEQHLNRIAMIRKSKMVIYTRSFHHPANYAGVFLCDNNEGNEKLRKMESPEHDKWDKDRYKEKGRDIDIEIRNFIRGSLKSLTKIRDNHILEIPGLHKYLPFDEESAIESNNNLGSNYTGNEGLEETSKEIGVSDNVEIEATVNPYKVSVINEASKGIGGSGVVKRKGKKKIKNKQEIDKGGGDGDRDSFLRSKLNSRAFITKVQPNEFVYRIVLKSEIDGKCNLKVFAVGEEGNSTLNIKSAKDVNGNTIKTSGYRLMNANIRKNSNNNIEVVIESKVKYSIKVDAYGLQQ